MRKIILDFFTKDTSIEIVGIFKNYSEITNFFQEKKCVVDCVILNLVYEEDLMNIIINIRSYVANIIAISNMDCIQVKKVKDISGVSNVKLLKYSDKLNLTNINDFRGEILKEVINIKEIKIERYLYGSKKAIVIASSTGGPKVLEEIFSKMKIKLDIPIFIVQHMPDGHSERFVNRLLETCEQEIRQGRNGEKINSNCIYFAPSGYHMEINFNNKISLNTNKLVNSVRPSADILFKSASEVYKEGLLAIVLTGMGRDGSNGVINVKNKGGMTIAQSERSCAVFGMPKAAIETGKVDMVLSIDKIVVEMLRHSGKIK